MDWQYHRGSGDISRSGCPGIFDSISHLGLFYGRAGDDVVHYTYFLSGCSVLGVDPIWFGVIVTMMMMLSIITPPVGINLFVISRPVKCLCRPCTGHNSLYNSYRSPDSSPFHFSRNSAVFTRSHDLTGLIRSAYCLTSKI